MAFMGIFLMWFVVFIAIISSCNFIAIVCFVISAVIKHRYKKNSALNPALKKPVSPVVLKAVGWVFLLPLIGTAGLICFALIDTAAEHRNSLWYNVNTGNFKQVERLIDKGASPDCTKESNEPAKNGEKSILISLCENQGFTVQNSFEDMRHDGFTEDEEKMIRLLIDKGADIEYKYYYHTSHEYDNYYYSADGCGRTPLLCAVERGDYELVRLLVESGADVNAKDAYGYNAAAIIADELNDENGADIARYLVENGADTSCTTKMGASMPFLLYRNERYGNEKIREILGYD